MGKRRAKYAVFAGLLLAVLLLGGRYAGRSGDDRKVPAPEVKETAKETAKENRQINPKTEGELTETKETDTPKEQTEEPAEVSGEETEAPGEPEEYDIVLSFAGDICLDDSCAVMQA